MPHHYSSADWTGGYRNLNSRDMKTTQVETTHAHTHRHVHTHIHAQAHAQIYRYKYELSVYT